VNDIQELANISGVRVGELPTNYMGMPLEAKNNSKGIWNGVLEKCERRLTNWKSYISME